MLVVSIEGVRGSHIPDIQASLQLVHLLDLWIRDLIVLLIQDQIRVPELRGPSIELNLTGRGNPHYGVLGVAGHTLDSVTGILVHVLPAVRLII